MELEIIKKEKKPLVKRQEVEARAVQNYTPSNRQVQEELAKLLEKDQELVVVKHIYSRFGSYESHITAYVYDDKQSLNKFEIQEKKKEREEAKKEAQEEVKQEKKEQEKEKKEEVKETKEEKPKEQAKEEKKEEDKEQKQENKETKHEEKKEK